MRYLKAGFAVNRLSTAWINKETSNLSNYYTGYVQGLIPVRAGDDLFEPYFAFRKFSETNDTYDIGMFYTFNNKILAGAAIRKGNVINGTIGFKPTKQLLIGYSREMITSSIGGYVGAANEITLRFDFNDESYKERFRADYRNAMSYRRKTISTPSRVSAQNPKQLKKRQKKLAPYTPNTRYQNVKKLSMQKKVTPPLSKKYKPSKKYAPAKKKRSTGSGFRYNQYNPKRRR
jgi:hypothetical protein